MKKQNKTKIMVILIIVMVIIISLITVVAVNLNTTKKAVKIGYITALTGRAAYFGTVDQKAALLAEKKLKEIYGEEAVQIIIEDSKSDSKEAANAANKLIKIDNVDAIFVEFTGPSGAVVPIAKDNDIAVLYSAYTTEPLTKYDYSVKTYRNAEAECTIYAKIAKSKGIEKIAVLDGAGGTNGIDCQRGALNYYTPENVKIENLAGVQDIKTVILKLNNEGYKGLFSYLYENATISVLTAKLDYSLNDMIFFGDASNTYTDKIKETIGVNNLNGTIISTLKYSDKFTNDYYLEYGNTDGLTANAPTNYDGIIMLYSAVKKCGRENKDCIVNAVLNDKITSTVINYGSSIGRSLNPQIDYHIIENGERVLLNTD